MIGKIPNRFSGLGEAKISSIVNSEEEISQKAEIMINFVKTHDGRPKELRIILRIPVKKDLPSDLKMKIEIKDFSGNIAGDYLFAVTGISKEDNGQEFRIKLSLDPGAYIICAKILRKEKNIRLDVKEKTNPAFMPTGWENDIFKFTVTKMETAYSLKNFYKPDEGKKFVVVYLTQENKSDKVQFYGGKFKLTDSNGAQYERYKGLSNFWSVALDPGGINFGCLVFEMPSEVEPQKLMLDMDKDDKTPAVINLTQK